MSTAATPERTSRAPATPRRTPRATTPSNSALHGALVLVVDDDVAIGSVICSVLRQDGFVPTCETSAEKALKRLEETTFEAILTDVNMPGGLDGFALARRALDQDPDLQIVLVTGISQTDTAIQAMRLGAADYLVKPFRLDELRFVARRAVEKRRLLVERRAYHEKLEEQVTQRTRELSERKRDVETLYRQLQGSYEETLESLAAALGSRDHETRGHSGRVVAYSCLLGEELGLDEEQLRKLRWGAILHDIGKIGIPDAILRKPGPLNDQETAEIRRHPELGFQMLRHISFLGPALEIVLHHHEWWDGSGYPAGLRGSRIPYSARIFSVADAYDAMTSDRPYRKALSNEKACEELLRFAGRQFEDKMVEVFIGIPRRRLDEVRAEVELSLELAGKSDRSDRSNRSDKSDSLRLP